MTCYVLYTVNVHTVHVRNTLCIHVALMQQKTACTCSCTYSCNYYTCTCMLCTCIVHYELFLQKYIHLLQSFPNVTFSGISSCTWFTFTNNGVGLGDDVLVAL